MVVCQRNYTKINLLTFVQLRIIVWILSVYGFTGLRVYGFTVSGVQVFMAASTLKNLQKGSAELRREQLVDIASKLIEAEGIEAVKHTRIAKIAGCTRSLVHHYFPKRSDIFSAVNANFYKRLDDLISVDQQIEVIRKNLVDDKPSRVHEIFFDLLDDGGWSSLILRTTPELSDDFASYVNTIHSTYEKRWINVVAERYKMSEVDSELFYQHSLNITKSLFLFYRKGLLTKQQAIEKIDSTLKLLLIPYQ